MKRQLLWLIIALLSISSAGAQSFEVGGLNYTVNNAAEWTVTLTGAVNQNILELDIPGQVVYQRSVEGGEPANIICTVTEVGMSAFESYSDLKKVTMPSTIKTLSQNAFRGCASLESIAFSDNITYMGNFCFQGCSSLTSIVLPSSLKEMDYDCFYGCSLLSDVTLNEGLETIGEGAFSFNDAMKQIVIPSSVKLIRSLAFYRCNVLEEVTFLGPVETVAFRAFDYSFEMKAVHVPDIETWCNIGFEYSGANPLAIAHNLYINGELATNLTIPGSIEEIKQCAFIGCTSLESVVLEDGIKRVGDSAFSSNTSLKSVVLCETLESIGGSSFLNTSIVHINFPNTLATLGRYSFSDCTQLESIDWGNGINQIGEYAFSGSTALKRVNIHDLSAWCKIDFNGTYSNPLNYAEVLELNGESIVDLIIPEDVKEILANAFEGCDSFKTLTIPDYVTAIGQHAFWDCQGLEKVHIGSGINNLDMYTFGTSYAINNLYIADGENPIEITSANNWADGWAIPNAISNLYVGRNFTVTGTLAADALFITLGKNVSEVKGVDFSVYSKLNMVTSNNSEAPVISEFDEEQYSKVVVKVPTGCVDTYKEADVWKNFNLITDAEEYAIENIKIGFDKDVYDVYPMGGDYKSSELGYLILPAEFADLPVVFTSDNSDLLVFENNIPQAKAYGKTTATVAIPSTGATAVVEVNTYAEVTGVTLSCGPTLTLKVGDTYQFEAEVSPQPIGTEMLSWESSSDALTIDESGKAVAVAAANDVYVTVRTYNNHTYSTLVTIKKKSTGISEVEGVETKSDVYDIAGICILKDATNSDIERLSTGTYIIRSGNKVTKLVK
ncbi:MAG: leucine-rich repeat domain-containing protein [Muribaculaceae bacterium]|nr:leucine-rich repeat domain-containing protein [Muribaculaceae bacterium]